MSTSNGFAGVSNCYVFKSRLQEYAQKAGIPTPVYDTVKEGPSHEPCFKSTVIVNNVRYDSLPGFFNRKAAEQSAAEIALAELAKSENTRECLSSPVHETGLCKNLLQEYAQKMNYAIPSYLSQKEETQGKSMFSSTVEIGGIQYIGAAAKTKKEAEIKAARTALLAIQSNTGGVEAKPDCSSQLMVLPCKKRGAELDTTQDDAVKPPKPKKARFKKKWPKKRFPRNQGENLNQAFGNTQSESGIHTEDAGILEVNKDGQGAQHVQSELNKNDAPGALVKHSCLLAGETNQNFQESGLKESNFDQNEQEISVVENASEFLVGDSGALVADMNVNPQERQPMSLNSNQNDQGVSNMGILSGTQIEDKGNITSSSMRVPEAPVFTVENSLSKDPLVGANKLEDGNSLVACELKQNAGEQVKVSQDGLESVGIICSEPVSEGVQLSKFVSESDAS